MSDDIDLTVRRDDVALAVIDHGGDVPPLLLLHGLAGSSRELLPTADALVDSFHVLLVDRRGHGLSTRRPVDLSRKAFVDDVVAVIQQLAPGSRARSLASRWVPTPPSSRCGPTRPRRTPGHA